MPQNGPTVICGDNQGAIYFTYNPKVEARSKHIDVRYHYVREFVENEQGSIMYINTDEQVADILTKSLAYQKQSKFSGRLGLVDV